MRVVLPLAWNCDHLPLCRLGKVDAMKAFWFLLWIPAIVVFYLSLHDEVLRERQLREHRPKPVLPHHAAHP